MKKSFEPAFYFTLTERRGIVSLLCMIGLVWVMQAFVPRMITDGKDPSFYLIEQDDTFPETHIETGELTEANSEPFHFNPNTLDKAGFQQLGLSPKTAQSIVNYRSKGGQFRKPEDFKKIYTLEEEDYKRLLPFIDLNDDFEPSLPKASEKKYSGQPVDPNTADSTQLIEIGLKPKVVKNLLNYRRKGGFIKTVEDIKKIWGMDDDQYERVAPHLFVAEKTGEENEKQFKYTPKPITEEERNIRLDINSASEAEFEFLYGIGPGYARRIVEFRDNLGGFHTIDQVEETWGFPDSTFQKIKPNLIIETPPGKIKLNHADIETLGKHPYIDWKKAKLLVRYREQHGDYNSRADVLKIKVLTPEWVDQVAVYFDYTPSAQ